ncbi:hypothetical protein ACFL3S_06935 [Gemmatimonadota bacterium]
MRGVGFVGILALSACTTYIPHPSDAPLPSGTEVRAELTTPGAVRISDLFGQPLRSVEGRVLSVSSDSMYVALLSATELGRPWDAVDTLSFAQGEILRLAEKRIDKKKTALLVGGVGTVSGVIIAALFRAATGSTEGEGPGEEDRTIIPIFSIIH